jgi:hypothetical protein
MKAAKCSLVKALVYLSSRPKQTDNAQIEITRMLDMYHVINKEKIKK